MSMMSAVHKFTQNIAQSIVFFLTKKDGSL